MPNIALSLSANIISLPLLAKSPPSCGEVSDTKSVLTVWNVESPLKNVYELAVHYPNLAVGTVPDAMFDAFKAVILEHDPLNAPENVVAVVTPVVNISPSGLTVIPEPTITSPELLILTLSVLLASLV